MGKVTECARPLQEILKFLSEDDLHDYVLAVIEKAREFKDKRGIGAIKSAQAEIEHTVFNEFVANYFENAQATIQNIKLYERNAELIKTGHTLRHVLVRDSTNSKNRSNNVESAQRAEQNYLMNKFMETLDDADMAYLVNRDNQLDIARAMMGESSTNSAKKIGEAFKQYVNERSVKMVESHALPLRYVNKDRFMKMSHDPVKMTTGAIDKTKAMLKGEKIDHMQIKNQWIDYIYNRLDLEKTFARTKADKGELGIDQAEVRGILTKMYDKILSGSDDVLGSAIKYKDLNMIQRKSLMFFQWKNAESWIQYNKQYGSGDLFGALLSDVHASGKRIGMARVMGAKPTTMYKKLAEVQQETKPKGRIWKRNTDLMFNEVTGVNSMVDSPTLARFFSNMRTWTSMGSLFTLPIQSLADMNMAATWMTRFNQNYMKSFIKQVDTVFHSQFTSPQKKLIAKQFHVHLNSHGGFMGRFSEAQNVGDITSKLSTQYFTKNGTVAWDRGNRVGVMSQTATALEQMSHLPYDRLNVDLKKLFDQFNITKSEWEALRTKNENGMFTMDNVEKLTDAELRAINKDRPDRGLYEIRNEVYRKVFSLFDVGCEQAILRPGAYERAMMYQGALAGTIPGELMRTLMQFKGFPYSYIMRNMVMGFRNADGVQAKMYYGLQQFAYTLPLSYLSTWAYFGMQGKTMPDPEKMPWSEKVDFYMGILAAPLGSLNGIWSGDNHNARDLIMSLFSNPSLRLMGSLAATPLAALSGDPEGVKKNARSAFLSVFPFTNAPFVSPYIRDALGQKPYLDEGQQTRSWAPKGD